jgi:hypothetical protein
VISDEAGTAPVARKFQSAAAKEVNELVMASRPLQPISSKKCFTPQASKGPEPTQEQKHLLLFARAER